MTSKDVVDDTVEWVSDTNIHADGFWNPNGPTSVGSKMVGVLILLRTTFDSGKKLPNPFYIFELTEDLTRDAYVDQKKVDKLPKGSMCGVSAWKTLTGITRRQGHEFTLVYNGKQKLDSGKSLVKLKVSYSRKMVREVEKLSAALSSEGDTEDT